MVIVTVDFNWRNIAGIDADDTQILLTSISGEYSKPLGDVIKSARKRMDLTQNEVADSIDVDVRTIINIENYKGNPKLEVLYPLIRSLKIDAREIFYPEMQRESPALRQLRLLVEDCSEEEAATIIPVLQSVISALRDKNATPIT